MKPRGTVTRTNQPKAGYLKVGEPQIEIAKPPEQVHFIIHWPAQLSDLPPLVLRFKSPDTLGFFIEELNRYRNAVWPDAEKVNLTQEPNQ
jgi:hypothetical protein